MIFGKKEKELRDSLRLTEMFNDDLHREPKQIEADYYMLKDALEGERKCTPACVNCEHRIVRPDRNNSTRGRYDVYDCELNIKCKDYKCKQNDGGLNG